MSFNSINYLIFFPIVVFLYFLLPKKIRMYWLLVASYYFYMSWDARYGLLILFSTVITYTCGLALDKVKRNLRGGGVPKILKINSDIFKFNYQFRAFVLL